MSIKNMKEKPPILYRAKFINFLTHKRNKMTTEEALQYVKWLDDVNVCFNMDVVSDIYKRSVHVYSDLIPFLRKHLREGDAYNCIKALKAYSRFIEKSILPEEIYPEQSISYVEGASLIVKVNRFERNQMARETCISHHGASCKVCGINFAQKYGNLGAGFIHVHHLIPVSEIRKEYKVDPINDLVPVCPNCHAMLHRKTPPLTVGQLKQLMGRN